MAKLNTSNAVLIAQLFNPKTGAARSVRSDRVVLSRSIIDGRWVKIGKVKAELSVDDYVIRRRAQGWVPYKRGCVPSFAEIQRMEEDGITKATDGCTGIEPDGKCEHGCPSWVTVALLGC